MKINNTNISFGQLVIDQAQKTTVPISVLCCNEDVKKALADSFESLDKASGDSRISLNASECYDHSANQNKTVIRLSSVRWQKILPKLSIYEGASTEEILEAIKIFTEKAVKLMSIASVPDISALLGKYNGKK